MVLAWGCGTSGWVKMREEWVNFGSLKFTKVLIVKIPACLAWRDKHQPYSKCCCRTNACTCRPSLLLREYNYRSKLHPLLALWSPLWKGAPWNFQFWIVLPWNLLLTPAVFLLNSSVFLQSCALLSSHVQILPERAMPLWPTWTFLRRDSTENHKDLFPKRFVTWLFRNGVCPQTQTAMCGIYICAVLTENSTRGGGESVTLLLLQTWRSKMC